MNRDLFRIDPSSYISPCYFSLVLTAFYGKIMVPANVAKFWLQTSNNAYGRQKNKVYRKCQQIDPAFDSQGLVQIWAGDFFSAFDDTTRPFRFNGEDDKPLASTGFGGYLPVILHSGT